MKTAVTKLGLQSVPFGTGLSSTDTEPKFRDRYRNRNRNYRYGTLQNRSRTESTESTETTPKPETTPKIPKPETIIVKLTFSIICTSIYCIHTLAFIVILCETRIFERLH